MSWKRAAIVSFVCCVLCALTAGASEEVSALIDAYEAAVSAPASITARVSCRSYVGGRLQPAHFSGVVTWSAGKNPFLLMTITREETAPNGKSTISNPILVANRDDALCFVDGVNSAYYEERMGRTGAHLVSSRLDVTFLLLRYPQLLEGLRTMQGVVSNEYFGTTSVRRLVVDDRLCHLEMVVDAATGLPIRVDRTVIGGENENPRTVLELSDVKVSKATPPEVLFDIDGVFSFPRKRYDPSGLFALPSAPRFDARLLDGTTKPAASMDGRWVFLCFHSECDGIRSLGQTNFERAGDLVRSRGGVFLDAYPTSVLEASGASCVYRADSAVRAADLADIFGITKTGLPAVVVIDPAGKVRAMLVGYIPSVSEREMEAVVNECLPEAK